MISYNEPTATAPSAAPTASNPAAIVALVSGLLGFVFLPFVFGPIALIAGCVGLAAGKAKRTMAGWGLALGAIDTAVAIWALYTILIALSSVR